MKPSSDVKRPGHQALRKGRTSIVGQIYLVTFTTHERKQLFSRHEAAITVARAIYDPRIWGSSQLLAWILMPDHWHALIQLGPLDDLSCRVRILKTNSARVFRQVFPETKKVWARAFHDRALREEDDLLETARYLVMNPIRAHLVKRIGDYPYWNAVWL